MRVNMPLSPAYVVPTLAYKFSRPLLLGFPTRHPHFRPDHPNSMHLIKLRLIGIGRGLTAPPTTPPTTVTYPACRWIQAAMGTTMERGNPMPSSSSGSASPSPAARCATAQVH